MRFPVDRGRYPTKFSIDCSKKQVTDPDRAEIPLAVELYRQVGAGAGI